MTDLIPIEIDGFSSQQLTKGPCQRWSRIWGEPHLAGQENRQPSPAPYVHPGSRDPRSLRHGGASLLLRQTIGPSARVSARCLKDHAPFDNRRSAVRPRFPTSSKSHHCGPNFQLVAESSHRLLGSSN